MCHVLHYAQQPMLYSIHLPAPWKMTTILKNCSLLLLGCWITGVSLFIHHWDIESRELDQEFEWEAALPLEEKSLFLWLYAAKSLLLISEMHKLLFDKFYLIYFPSPFLLLLLRVQCAAKIKLQDSEIRCLSQYAIFFTSQLSTLHHYNCMLDSFFIFISFYWMCS